MRPLTSPDFINAPKVPGGFFHSHCNRGSLLGRRVSSATLRQPWRARIRYTAEAATACPRFCANAARSGEATKTPPAFESSCQRAKKSRAAYVVSEARRRPTQLGRTASGLSHRSCSLHCSLRTLARPTPSAIAVCSRFAPSSAGSSTAGEQRTESISAACSATPWACVTNSTSSRRGLALSRTLGKTESLSFS